MGVNSLSTILAHWPVDWILLGALAGLIALDALRSGSARAASLILALPATVFVNSTLPRAIFIGPLVAKFGTSTEQLVILAVIFVILYIAIHRIVFTFSDSGGPLQALIAGLAAAIVAVVFWLQIPGLESIWHFGTQVQTVFGEAYRFWWLILAYLGIAFVRS